MYQVVSPRTSSLHRSSNSAPGYFEYHPERSTIDSTMEASSVHRLDAFHARLQDFDMPPKDMHVYARRALPPLPQIQTKLRKASSSKSLRSPVSPLESARPSLCSQDRAYTSDLFDRPLPPLPALTRVPSAGSLASSKPSDSDIVVPVRRPRAMRSISFRNFLNRNTYPSSTTSESQRSVSSMSAVSDVSSHDSRHDSILEEVGMCKTTTTTVVVATATSGRRPSTLSLVSLRSRKATLESQPPVPRPASGRRWGLFSNSAIEDAENIPPVPITPPPVTELSCHRCYYFSMRNCNGWVMGGSHGDACDSCTMHGFFGSP